MQASALRTNEGKINYPYVRANEGHEDPVVTDSNAELVTVFCDQIAERPNSRIFNDIQLDCFCAIPLLHTTFLSRTFVRGNEDVTMQASRHLSYAYTGLLRDQRPDEGVERIIEFLTLRRLLGGIKVDDEVSESRDSAS